MTFDQLEAIFKANNTMSREQALRAVWNAGWYEGAGITPTATSPDKSKGATKPVAIIVLKSHDRD